MPAIATGAQKGQSNIEVELEIAFYDCEIRKKRREEDKETSQQISRRYPSTAALHSEWREHGASVIKSSVPLAAAVPPSRRVVAGPSDPNQVVYQRFREGADTVM
jgi:hypothetical protein